jgi:hypothetical protein
MTPQEQHDFNYYHNISKRSANNVRKAAVEEGITQGEEKNKKKMIDAMKESGLSDEQIKNVLKLAENQE